MRKFHEWISLREDGDVPNTPHMSPGGNTPMPLAHAQGQPNQPSGGPGPGPGEQGEGEDSELSGNMKRHLDMLINDLEQRERIPRAKSIEVLERVVAALKGGGMKKNMANTTVKGAF